MTNKLAKKRAEDAAYRLRERTALMLRPPTNRSKVTNGTKLFVEGDNRSPWARRYRDLAAGHISDLGGADQLSEAQVSLIKRAATIETELEQQEGKLSQGEQINLDCYTRSASHLRRLLETLGLERKAKDVKGGVIEHDADDVKRLLELFEPNDIDDDETVSNASPDLEARR